MLWSQQRLNRTDHVVWLCKHLLALHWLKANTENQLKKQTVRWHLLYCEVKITVSLVYITKPFLRLLFLSFISPADTFFSVDFIFYCCKGSSDYVCILSFCVIFRFYYFYLEDEQHHKKQQDDLNADDEQLREEVSQHRLQRAHTW